MKPSPVILSGVLSIAWMLSLPVVANAADSLPSFWVDDDLNEAFAKAGTSGKPLMIVFRCVP